MTKQEIRRLLATECRLHYANGDFPEWSKSVVERVRSNQAYIDAHCVLLYNALWDEVDLSALFADDKQFVLPTVVGDELELHLYTSGTATHTGAFGITESGGPLLTDYGTIDLAIIPGRAFTADGRRLGRGKGYYDRTLPRLRCHTIGVCFPFQLLSDIPTETHDHKINEVITTI
ncbi:MAG: 5-formyltetrahydrofolate cyclo-ligase [Prevotellaceae bacterium]|nr:5-formyltetrahydrofolate cyclo-ligase [Candidatus Colivivens caballi]